MQDIDEQILWIGEQWGEEAVVGSNSSCRQAGRLSVCQQKLAHQHFALQVKIRSRRGEKLFCSL